MRPCGTSTSWSTTPRTAASSPSSTNRSSRCCFTGSAGTKGLPCTRHGFSPATPRCVRRWRLGCCGPTESRIGSIEPRCCFAPSKTARSEVIRGAVGLLSQARLTFLAYAGAADTVAGALTDARREVLGLSAASSALFRGIAYLRAGHPTQAREHWEAVPKLAGSSEDRVVDASRRATAALDGFGPTDTLELDADMQRYVGAVAQRLDAFLRAAPKTRRGLPRFGAPLLTSLLVVGYVAALLLDRGGYGFVDLGAMVPVLWGSGDWFRLASGAWDGRRPDLRAA